MPFRPCAGLVAVRREYLVRLRYGRPRRPGVQCLEGAVRVFTKVTASHHAKDNIRCNSIHPGPIDTPMTQTSDAARREKIIADVPLGRYGTSEDIAYGVLYLASDEAAFMTGAELVIDGGYTAQ